MTTLIEAARTGRLRDTLGATVGRYRGLYGAGAGVDGRKAQYERLVNQYYDMVTDFYEYGWGRSFHFAHRWLGESLRDSIVRHEHFLAMRLGLGPGMTALDVGCGVGGPLLNIVRFSGARVVGLNNNAYQVERGQGHAAAEEVEGASFLLGDFMEIPAEDDAFDAAYAIESTCHAPDRRVVFEEVRRVLRPGALFGGYEWCLTERFDPQDPQHAAVKRGIEEGDALPDLTPCAHVDRALAAAGFEVLETRDLTPACHPDTPWYLPLAGGELTPAGLGMSPVGRRVTRTVVRGLQAVRLVPRGAAQVHAVLTTAADALVRGGELGIFTPLYFFLARNPA